MHNEKTQFDYDQVVIGSGFGGACSALRLTEKGCKVLVLEKGRRFQQNDFAKSSWNLRRFFWLPSLGLTGPFQLSLTRKINVVHGSGVGGGSLVYGNTHLIPDAAIFDAQGWTQSKDDWYAALQPYYALAQRMIGVQRNRYFGPADHIMQEIAEDNGRADKFDTVYSGLIYPEGADEMGVADAEKLGSARGDPYFSGDGPERNSCTYCGNCMVGCRDNAKNSLDKNYLYFAERNGAEVRAESKVTRIEPIAVDAGEKEGSAGYRLTVVEGLGVFGGRRYQITARGVVVSAGVMGSLPLLLKARDIDKTLPNISRHLGQRILTNSETLMTVTHDRLDKTGQQEEVCHGTAITSIYAPDDETNIEIVRYAKGSDVGYAGILPVPMTDKSKGGIPRSVMMLSNLFRHPLRFLKTLNPVGKAKESVILLVMQSTTSYLHFTTTRPWYWLGRRSWVPMQKATDAPLANYFPVAHEFARQYVAKSQGLPGNSLLEVVLGAPMTAHMMGGAHMGKGLESAVVDETGEVFGYQNLRVLDGSIIGDNLAVNPSLTILALTEHAMSQLPVFDQQRADAIEPIRFSEALPGCPSSLQQSGVLTEQLDEITALEVS
ncbi:Cholesterol oxidase [Sinobacterium norvegicum]|uniref:Cholesterol oxidase n=1 Tax=Sinobacterium norvegicum TaxID=1641715 RepID=A0ABN8EBU3_9GAMM|nr:GMC family oxidoreductase [Sinobacterium norvegicum]CAH0989960.1 Cholesterol oxidase [Sinobacterium norvegicum]